MKKDSSEQLLPLHDHTEFILIIFINLDALLFKILVFL